MSDQQKSEPPIPAARGRREGTADALRRNEEVFRLLVEGVKDYAIFALDPEGHVSTWNAGAERIKGYRAMQPHEGNEAALGIDLASNTS